MPVIVTDRTDSAPADTIRAIEASARAALERHGASSTHALTVVLTDDEALRHLNRTYRAMDRPTDVLSFPTDPDDTPPGETPYVGDVIISINQAAQNASLRGMALADELALLAVHGTLHLLGFEDKTDEGAEAMRRAEVELGVRPADDVDAPD